MLASEKGFPVNIPVTEVGEISLEGVRVQWAGNGLKMVKPKMVLGQDERGDLVFGPSGYESRTGRTITWDDLKEAHGEDVACEVYKHLARLAQAMGRGE